MGARAVDPMLSTPVQQCVKITHVDKVALGRRLARAREDIGMTQESLGRVVGLDRTAITRLEKGERRLSVPELVSIAARLGRPLSYFVDDPVPAVVSRRTDSAHAHQTTRALDVELEAFAGDVRILLDMNVLIGIERRADAHVPRNHIAAERAATNVREQVGLGSGPLDDLGGVCERLGLLTFSASLGADGPDGGCVEVTSAGSSLGAAVVNGDKAAGRRRMTLGHELGHWLFGDAYDREASGDNEKMINAFAIHFLAPRGGVRAEWDRRGQWSVRDRALAVSASFRLSWSAAVSQLRNVNLLSADQHAALTSQEPSRGDYIRLGLSWQDELVAPYVSPGFASSCVRSYAARRLTAARTVELLRGTLARDDLPDQDIADLRKHFDAHGD